MYIFVVFVFYSVSNICSFIGVIISQINMDAIKMELDSDSGTSMSLAKVEPESVTAEYGDGQISEPGMMQLHSKVIYEILMNLL